METLDQPQCKPPASPGKDGGKRVTFSDRVSELILQSCRSKDSSARISTILRDSSGRTVVRVRTGESSDAVSLLRALRDLWPLAKTTVVENHLDGSVEAQIIVPREEDERRYARHKASSSRCAGFLHTAVFVLFFVGVVLYIKDVYYRHVAYSATIGASGGAHASTADDRDL